MNVCGECELLCGEVCKGSEETRHTGETGRGASGVWCAEKEDGVKKRKEGKRQERGKQGSEAGSAY